MKPESEAGGVEGRGEGENPWRWRWRPPSLRGHLKARFGAPSLSHARRASPCFLRPGSGEGKAGGRVQERGPWILIFWKKGGCGSEEGMWMECPRLVGRRGGGLGRGFSFVIGLHSYWCADNRKCNSLF